MTVKPHSLRCRIRWVRRSLRRRHDTLAPCIRERIVLAALVLLLLLYLWLLFAMDMVPELVRQRVEDTLKICGLYPFRNWPISALSFGQKKRVTIASVLVQQPELIILDEPFNFLDPSSQSVIKHLLKKYNEEHNATVIISSHNLNHTVAVCPRIAVLEHGVIIRDLVNENNSAEKELEDYFNVEEE